ncbi:gfo/Idh/MocA family oxidoreductase [Paenibacillus pinisoli]|uniref:Gfo/Idh/MocA family oxidoreductase n=1 Tax=Paenibacillus pinisoli TaxID=1276110 RepID=A0A3A6PWA0_9BACL|nr:Gfo/Idh/MocA family oxidoreductase [Paenibacillus pinisoli]RJX38134.1 gfo/Idh/MocA family oxidoreductase [Paenibacillus pinisoli]
MSQLKVGMISFAHEHAFSYLDALLSIPEVTIVGIADPVPARVAEATGKHNIAYYNDYHVLLEQPMDAVVICSENALHAEITIAAASKGIHVLCEKPLGISIDEMNQMVEACERNKVQLMTAFPCRYLAAVVQAKQTVDRGEIGEIVAIKGTNRGTAPSGWFVDRSLSGGGALLDHTVHVMDLMRWFTGSEPAQVYAYASTLFNDQLKVDDAGMIHVKFENGTFGVVDTSWSRKPPFPTWGDVTMEIIGTKGVLSVDSLAQVNEVYSQQDGLGQWNYWGDNMDLHLIRSFVEAIRSGTPVPITGLDGLRSAAVALAGYQSIQEGQPVKLNA